MHRKGPVALVDEMIEMIGSPDLVRLQEVTTSLPAGSEAGTRYLQAEDNTERHPRRWRVAFATQRSAEHAHAA